MTVEVQPDPRHHISQDRLKWASDRPAHGWQGFRDLDGDPFTDDNISSTGLTLMNNQAGVVAADVTTTKPGVRVPAAAGDDRVDGERRMDVVYDEISSARFEKGMSSYYGRMIYEDNQAIMF